jgi:hypothetical protein
MPQQNHWPPLSADEYFPTSHLLFMCVQMVGKLMLTRPFEPHWANLAMPLTSRGVTTGVIPFESGTFSIEIDFIDHQILLASSRGKTAIVKLASMPVAELAKQFFKALKSIDVNLKINLLPQETSNLIPFDQDTAARIYDGKVVNTWWTIMLNTYRVLLTYHSRFYGISPLIGLCWGTLDLRDARYKGLHLPKTATTANYIMRNSMDDAQVEVGFSCNNEKYLIPSFFGFAYPHPAGFENAKMKPDSVKWVAAIGEFILDYDDLRKSVNPDEDLLLFFENYYQTVADLADWDTELIVSGQPV